MDIKTKLNIGDAIFFLHDKRVIESTVQIIKTDTFNSAANAKAGEVFISTEILYLCNNEKDQRVHIKVEEQFSFKTKAELLKSL